MKTINLRQNKTKDKRSTKLAINLKLDRPKKVVKIVDQLTDSFVLPSNSTKTTKESLIVVDAINLSSDSSAHFQEEKPPRIKFFKPKTTKSKKVLLANFSRPVQSNSLSNNTFENSLVKTCKGHRLSKMVTNLARKTSPATDSDDKVVIFY